MNINLSNLVDAAVPDRGDRNVAIVSDNRPNHRDPGFLSSDFPRSRPKLYITAESDGFDELTLNEWRDEGFDVEYISMGIGDTEYQDRLRSLSKADLGPCQTYGIIAYGDAAALCLEHFHIIDNNPEFKLGCLIAYYPTSIPDPSARFPSSIRVLVHLAGTEVGIIKRSQLVGVQGKKRISRKKIDPGLGTGGTLKLAYTSYTYAAEPGFAEFDLDEYDSICAELAWTRSLATVRRAFEKEVDLELALEQNVQSKFYTRDLQQTMSAYSTHKTPHVTHIPTLTGGSGTEELERFYSQFFIARNPPSMRLTLITRTTGADRVVDEMFVYFKHTREMPWILPGVPPTKKWVEILVVSIVTLRGGKLYHEHIYWDQASVLMQVGLLDPKLIPAKAKESGVTQLPVVGKEAARRVLGISGSDDEGGEARNELIREWDSSDSGHEEDRAREEQKTVRFK